LLVHEWLLRHIYMESLRNVKVSKNTATILTFLFSAFIHELVFWVSFQVVRPWFFLGMFVQVPLIIVSRLLVKMIPPKNARRWGNVFVWFSLFIGQPLLEILYMREWFFNHSDFFCFEKTPFFSDLVKLFP